MTAGPFERIVEERDFQNRKWGKQRHSNETWNWIFLEEYGEVARAILEVHDGMSAAKVESELVQTLAVGVAWLEDMLERGVALTEKTGGNNSEAGGPKEGVKRD